MLIQETAGPSGKVSALPIHRPAASFNPNADPAPIMSRQSAATWFQPASIDSGQTSSASSGRSRRMVGAAGSEAAIAHLVTGRLAVAGAAADQPVSRPVEHALEGHARRAELGNHAPRIVDPARLRLGTCQHGRAP